MCMKHMHAVTDYTLSNVYTDTLHKQDIYVGDKAFVIVTIQSYDAQANKALLSKVGRQTIC